MTYDAVKSLNAVTAVGNGTSLRAFGRRPVVMIVDASAVTSGGTVLLQGRVDDSSWATLATDAITADGTTLSTYDGPVAEVRARLDDRTDGVYSAWIALAD